MAIKISGETVVDDSKKGLFNDVVVKGGAGESGEITLNCENNSHGVKLKGPAHSAGADYTLTLPDTSGNNGEVLTTDGSGVMSWEEVVGNEISATAPTSPSQGALWTDTSEDPAAPILKTWNGSAWVAVGSASPSEFAPVVNGVTLTENDTTGDRFTSQTFDVAIDMLIEGSPHSQKELKGEVTASFAQHPNTEPVASNNAVSFPNTNRTSTQNSYGSNGYQVVPVWAPGATEGQYEWYSYYFPSGSGSNGSFCTFDIHNITQPKETLPGLNNSITFSGSSRMKWGKYFPATWNGTTGDTREWIILWKEADASDSIFRAYRYTDNPSAQWYAGWSPITKPWYDEETNQYYWYYDRRVLRGDTFGSADVATGYMSSVSNHGSGGVAVGNGRVVALRSSNAYQYVSVYVKDFVEGQGVQWNGQLNDSWSKAKDIYFENGYFWVPTHDGRLYRSYDGTSWNNVSIPRLNGVDGYIEVDYIDMDPNNPGVMRAWGMGWSNGNSGTHQRYIFTTNNNGATWVATWGAPKSRDYFNECIPLFGDGIVAFVDHGDDNGYNRMGTDSYPYSSQTVTLQGTGESYSEFNVGDAIRKAGTTGFDYEGTITSISGSDIGLNSPYIYQAGDVIEAKYPTSSGIATRYLVIESTGAITGTIGADPGYVSMSPDVNQTLTFPATFASGDAPDDELPAGTTLKVSAKATNSEGSSEFGPSNIVTPS